MTRFGDFVAWCRLAECSLSYSSWAGAVNALSGVMDEEGRNAEADGGKISCSPICTKLLEELSCLVIQGPGDQHISSDKPSERNMRPN